MSNMKQYVLAIDQGTTSTKAFLLSKDGKMLSAAGVPISQSFPKPGYVSQNADEIYYSVLKAVANVLPRVSLGVDACISSIAITNQRETTICFEKDTGSPICPAIVWQCRRTADICLRSEIKAKESKIQKKTGLKLDPYFSATKMRWMMENVEGCELRVRTGSLLFGTVDSYLVYRLTGLKSFATDYSNASRTMLFNINTLDYDEELLRLFGIPRDCVAKALPSCSDFGSICLSEDELRRLEFSQAEIDELMSLNGVKISAIAGDQAAALFGQACLEKGQAKTTYGTGCFTLLNVGNKPVFSQNGLLTSATWSYKGETFYALEGSIFQAGSIITWLKDELGILSKASDCDRICKSISDNGGVYLVPAFSGLGAPYWDAKAKGMITGLTQGTSSKHIVRAGIEAIAYQVNTLIRVMETDTKCSLESMKVDGGICACDFLMQFQADMLQKTVIRGKYDEMTARGVGIMSLLSTGELESLEQAKAFYEESISYSPQMEPKSAKTLMDSYEKAVHMVVNSNK